MTPTVSTYALSAIMGTFVLISLITGKSTCRSGDCFDKSPIGYSITTGLQAAFGVLCIAWTNYNLDAFISTKQLELISMTGLDGSAATHLVTGSLYIGLTIVLSPVIFLVRKTIVSFAINR